MNNSKGADADIPVFAGGTATAGRGTARIGTEVGITAIVATAIAMTISVQPSAVLRQAQSSAGC
ncbi:hypothetical protein USDA257_c43190 [Sinorhizobium fredii USDA 257]|uniref:Uncharacterized protein n=1 Tax=Sinorhizobium fredii (strain USDA 257) TaxID=1185652 RepID=I3XAF2_SINF2|nr:hypothetical protein USDA257_c43190 [Sinorhizobium fredii USDA 257]